MVQMSVWCMHRCDWEISGGPGGRRWDWEACLEEAAGGRNLYSWETRARCLGLIFPGEGPSALCSGPGPAVTAALGLRLWPRPCRACRSALQKDTDLLGVSLCCQVLVLWSQQPRTAQVHPSDPLFLRGPSLCSGGISGGVLTLRPPPYTETPSPVWGLAGPGAVRQLL